MAYCSVLAKSHVQEQEHLYTLPNIGVGQNTETLSNIYVFHLGAQTNKNRLMAEVNFH
jgi:hypothetical protein